MLIMWLIVVMIIYLYIYIYVYGLGSFALVVYKLMDMEMIL